MEKYKFHFTEMYLCRHLTKSNYHRRKKHNIAIKIPTLTIKQI